jgi:hypothetical protein
MTVMLDGMVRRDNAVPLVDDRSEHTVEVSVLGGTRAPAPRTAAREEALSPT